VTLQHTRIRGIDWLALLLLSFLLGPQTCQAEETPGRPAQHQDNPVAAGIQALLKAGVHPRLHWGQFSDFQTQLESLYQPTGYRPLWTQENKTVPQAQAVIAELAAANSKGLNAADYDTGLLQQWLTRLNSGTTTHSRDLASFDVALSLSLMRYASNLYVGRINPRHVNFALDIEPKKLDLPALVSQVAHSDKPVEIIGALEPKLRLYENLKIALARYELLAKESQPTAFTFPAKFKPGDRNNDVPALRHILTLLGDLSESHQSSRTVSKSPELYDKELAEAVKRFQSRHGLAADGVIGSTTLAQLNIPLADRIKQIQLGLERLRWLPEQLNGPYLIVNIPSFQLFGFENGSGKPDIEMNVIVGEAINERNTPVFHADMTYVIFRPYWNLPDTITAKEMLPRIRRNPGYLDRNNLEIVPNFSSNAPVYQPSFETIQMLSSGALKLRQRPGPKNALGLVKFAFPNDNNVYLHSTPTRGLFKKARRDFSHGCIRVEDPVGLAQWVLRDQDAWTRERIQQAMNRDRPKTVTLKTELPVYIFYSTVLADENGKVMFFDDIYGHDTVLQGFLGQGFPYPS